MFASVLQLVALVGLAVGLFLVAGLGGAVVGVSIAAGFVGLALERAAREG
jgi:hypothetical protein